MNTQLKSLDKCYTIHESRTLLRSTTVNDVFDYNYGNITVLSICEVFLKQQTAAAQRVSHRHDIYTVIHDVGVVTQTQQ